MVIFAHNQWVMYTSSGFSDFEVGDITVIIHNGVYHLFHLIIPNHDYIAHAVSKDGISWKRVKNALFVGDPGEWDDDMLWTMDVRHDDGKFNMYYTGLQRKDRGRISRIGFAASDDLIEWKKTDKPVLFVEPQGMYYENAEDNPRNWLSFRDPYRFDHEGEMYLLVCARSNTGPLSRRGCVGVVKISGHDTPQFLPPLLYPRAYDDIECPCLFTLNGNYYLLGSIREDIKVRYWTAPSFFGEYHSFHADVLLPNGNYAARIVEDGAHLLLFNFYYTQGRVDLLRVLPPPKQLDTDDKGRLLLKSFYRFELMVTRSVLQEEIPDVNMFLENPTASAKLEANSWQLESRSGYEVFCFERPSFSFIWEGCLRTEGLGKFGIVSDMDKHGNGYYIIFDIDHGLVTIRSWGYNPANERQNFIFTDMQSNVFNTQNSECLHFKLIRYGNYIELSINGLVKLSLMDYAYQSNFIGVYAASAAVVLQDSVIKTIPDPEEEYASPVQ